MTATTLPQSAHFTFHQLAEGVWAAIALSSGLAASNGGIVDLGEHTLIFDTTYSPASATDLRSAAEHLTGRPVTYVLNSHWHADHVFGNAVFAPQTELYATTRTCEIMSERLPAEITAFKAYWPTQAKAWAESARQAKTDAERIDFADGVRFAQAIIATFPQLEMRLPDHTFANRLELTGTRRTVEFVTLGGGHTDSDAFLHLPADRLIFTGDLLVVQNHPDLTYGHPHDWLKILADIRALDPLCLVPGHGELGTVDDSIALEHYINDLLHMAELNVQQNGTAESAIALQPPSFTAGWNNADAFERNMKCLHESMQV